jgi:predicted SnoaL-like aldol condensation-catalyzing enzyme
MKDEYRAVMNFFRNTQKLTPEELQKIVRAVVVDVVREEVQRFILTKDAERLVRDAVKSEIYRLHDDIAKVALDELLNERLAQQGRGFRVPKEMK